MTTVRGFLLGGCAPLLVLAACTGSLPPLTAPAAQTYACASGARITAAYPDAESATVQYRGQTRQMRIAASANGARYADERLEWWTRGSGQGAGGMLLRHNVDGTSGDVLERCVAE